MSLLMDALKKAELAKRHGGESGTGENPNEDSFGALALEPLIESPDSATPASEPERTTGPDTTLSTHLEELDARFLEEAAAAARQLPSAPVAPAAPVTARPDEPGPTAAISQARIDDYAMNMAPPPTEPARRAPREADDAPVKAAAQNLFDAKHPERKEGRKGFAIAIGALTVLSVCGIGGYFWWQLQPKSGMMAKPGAPPAPPPAALAAPSPPAAPTVAVAPAPTPAPAAPSAAVAGSAPSGGVTAAATPRLAAGAAESDDEAASPRARSGQRRAATRPIDVPDDENPVRITRQPLRIDPALNRGYEAFNRGELTLAQLEYERARKNDPRNTDVLHGLAALALRQGRHDQAEALYRQIIEYDPQDGVATSALLNQRGHVDPGLTESRLKSIAASEPELAAPHFSLGNLYSRMGRWNDAQQAYFRAFNAEPDNPDILYNLAISLEHMRQNKLAAQYYSLAIAAAASRPAGFDRAQVAARLKTLQP